jgi:hypothetical protein
MYPPWKKDVPLYTASPDLSIPTSLDSSLETTAHQPEGLQDGAGDAIYRHAYRTFGCKHCTAVHAYVALARCGDRTCTECRVKDFYRLYNAYAPQMTQLGKHGLKLVTLTQKNRESLEGAVDDLREAWKKLRRRTPYNESWQGGLYAVEAVNKGRGWHVHLHVLVEGGYVSQGLLARDWQELTGDSWIVDIREVDALYGLKYTLKYLKKAPTISGHVDEYNEVLKGTRLVQAWGSWYGEVQVKEEEDTPKLVCAVCGHSEWMVILQQPEMSLEAFRAQREVLAFFDARARAG